MNSATKIRSDFRGVLFGFRNLGDFGPNFRLSIVRQRIGIGCFLVVGFLFQINLKMFKSEAFPSNTIYCACGC